MHMVFACPILAPPSHRNPCSASPDTPHLHPLPHPHHRCHRRQAGMALLLVSHGTPRPPSTRSLDSNADGDMGIHKRADGPRQRGHGVRLLRPTPRRTAGGTYAPPTAQMPHPPRQQGRQGTAIDHHVPEYPPQYGIPLPPDVRVYHPGAPGQRTPSPHPTSPGHHHPGDRRLCGTATAAHANHHQNRPREPCLHLSAHSNCPPTHTQRHQHHLLH